MKRAMHLLIPICLFVISSNFLSVAGTESVTLEPSGTLLTTPQTQDFELATDYVRQGKDEDDEVKAEQRSIDFHGGFDGPAANEDRHAAFRKRAKPLKSIFMGLYKNYKSTYLGNKTLTDYRKAMRPHKDEAEEFDPADTEVDESEQPEATTESDSALSKKIAQESETLKPVYVNEPEKQSGSEDSHEKLHSSKKKRKKQRLRKSNHRRTAHNNATHAKRTEESEQEKSRTTGPVYRYDFGHGYNMSLDMSNDIVNLHLDGDSLRDLMQGRFFKEGNEGRGKKYEMITRVLPLFIIPFLIQSAVVPFLVTKLKLLLMKSILVGKLAIFLLVISAIKNGNKMMQTYEVAPSYWAGEPSRRSELAAAASAAAYNGYRVEGKPAAWIN